MVTKADPWVLLAYRIPREPSTPRITVWRKLRRLGVVQLVDGLVALPADSRTREQLEWVADQVVEAGGEASIWLGQPGSAGQGRAQAHAGPAAPPAAPHPPPRLLPVGRSRRGDRRRRVARRQHRAGRRVKW